MNPKSNITLIGMPTAGKTVLGQKLANELGMKWMDTDHLILKDRPNLIEEKGEYAFLETEQHIINGIDVSNYVISTGGSAVYSPIAMAHLKGTSLIVYIRVSITTLRSRMEDYVARGVIGAKEKSLEELFAERTPLYEKYADIIADCAIDDLDVQYTSLLDAIRHLRALKYIQ